jgi:hypothetical protein
MHVLDQAVGRHDDALARRRLPDRGIVADAELELGRDSHVRRERRDEKLDQSKFADVANTTLVSHLPASRSSLHQRVRFVGLVA